MLLCSNSLLSLLLLLLVCLFSCYCCCCYCRLMLLRQNKITFLMTITNDDDLSFIGCEKVEWNFLWFFAAWVGKKWKWNWRMCVNFFCGKKLLTRSGYFCDEEQIKMCRNLWITQDINFRNYEITDIKLHVLRNYYTEYLLLVINQTLFHLHPSAFSQMRK